MSQRIETRMGISSSLRPLLITALFELVERDYMAKATQRKICTMTRQLPNRSSTDRA
jgi:hypothetical protein